MRMTLRYTFQVLAGIGLWATFYVGSMWWYVAGYTYYTPNSTVFLSIHLRQFSVIVFILAQIISYLGMRSFVRNIVESSH